MVQDDEKTVFFIGPALASDAAEGYRWRWVVSYGGERRSGACVTRSEAQAEAATVLKLLKARADPTSS